MTIFQLVLLLASAFFALKVYAHIQTLKDPEESREDAQPRKIDAFSTFNSEELIQKADNAFENGDADKALSLLNEANEKEANNPDILFKIAYILQGQSNDDKALKYYKEALKLDENNEFIHNALATIYKRNDEFVSARMHLDESLEIDESNPITYYNYGNLLVKMQKEDEAILMYEKALEINPTFDEAVEEIQKLKITK